MRHMYSAFMATAPTGLCARSRQLVGQGGSVSALGIFFDPCPTGDLLRGALSAVRAQCNYLDV